MAPVGEVWGSHWGPDFIYLCHLFKELCSQGGSHFAKQQADKIQKSNQNGWFLHKAQKISNAHQFCQSIYNEIAAQREGPGFIADSSQTGPDGVDYEADMTVALSLTMISAPRSATLSQNWWRISNNSDKKPLSNLTRALDLIAVFAVREVWGDKGNRYIIDCPVLSKMGRESRQG